MTPWASLKAHRMLRQCAPDASPVLIWGATPVGPLWAQTDGAGALTVLRWGAPPPGIPSDEQHHAKAQLDEYFAGKRQKFTLKFNPLGTLFQQRVWQALCAIPYGQAHSYAQVAATLGTHPRAVATACRTNPLPLFIPCHRVVSTTGALTGYSGAGGVATKQALLNLEKSAKAHAHAA